MIYFVIKKDNKLCKHSNADKLRIALLDQPKFYTIVIKDNGNVFDDESFNSHQGMGLLSLREIANKYNGFMNASYDDGFKIHMTLMK